MKVYSFSKEENVINNNGNIKKSKRVIQHNGKNGIEQMIVNGKVKTRRFKVKNNKRNNKTKKVKCKTIIPDILAFRRRNNKSNNAKGVTKRRKKTKRIKGNKKNRTKKSKRVKKNDKGFWEKLFF